jgi:hypothetical protein
MALDLEQTFCFLIKRFRTTRQSDINLSFTEDLVRSGCEYFSCVPDDLRELMIWT